MQREESIEELWDGRFYDKKDMVPVGCHDCEGCSDCCRNTGDSIILDPYDMYRLSKGIHKSFEEMIEKEIEIRVVDGWLLPNLLVHNEDAPDREDVCPFLNEQDRCTIHAFRPAFCRMFPIGRYYVEDGFRYFIQKNECHGKGERYMVRLEEWLDTPNLEQYERFVEVWHDFRKQVEEKLPLLTKRSQEQLQRQLLQIFFVDPYPGKKNFYLQFEKRLDSAKKFLEPLGI